MLTSEMLPITLPGSGQENLVEVLLDLALPKSDLELPQDFFSCLTVTYWYAKQLSNSVLLDCADTPEFVEGNRRRG